MLVLFQDAFGTRERINTPGTVDAANWAYRMPVTVEELSSDQATTERLAQLARDAGRSPAGATSAERPNENAPGPASRQGVEG